MDINKPYLIEFNSIGSSDTGYISVAEEFSLIPFSIKRVYWTYYTPQNVMRGAHANKEKDLVLVAVAGTIFIDTEMQDGQKNSFNLDNPDKGLYIPRLCWHTMKYSHNAVQMVLASTIFDTADYIRDYKVFRNGH